MVEKNIESILDDKLFKEWKALADSQPATSAFINSSVKRPLDEGGMAVFFNAKLVIYLTPFHILTVV